VEVPGPVGAFDTPAPPVSMSGRDTEAVRRHPRFRAAVETYAATNLTRYGALGTLEHWLVNDMGRASLSGAIFVLDAVNRLTPAALMSLGPVATGEVSRGRARLFLQQAVDRDFIERIGPGVRLASDTPLRATGRFHSLMADILHVALEAVAVLAPEAAPALDQMARRPFVQQLSACVGRIVALHPDLFPLASPVQLFQARNGGLQILEALILRQPAERERLLESCAYSISALARAARCSRPHVIQLLRDAKAQGLLRFEGGVLTLEPALSEAVEVYYANLFAAVRAAAASTLPKG
jgi:hypothetical protein